VRQPAIRRRRDAGDENRRVHPPGEVARG
jgi:hypothetical protein